MSEVELQPVRIRTESQDSEGRLALVDGELVAIFVRLDDPVHDSERGSWFLEAGFGRCDGVRPLPFRDLEEAAEWVKGRLSRKLGLSPEERQQPAG